MSITVVMRVTSTQIRRGRHRLPALGGDEQLTVDLLSVSRLDTAGALAVVRAAGERLDASRVKARPDIAQLLALVSQASKQRTPAAARRRGALAFVDAIGARVIHAGAEAKGTLDFLGHVLVAFAAAISHPRRVRWPALVNQMELAGLEAIPIVVITAFFIGAVVALLGAHMLEQFGAQVFVVDLIGLAVLREFGVIIAAVLMAGRSA